MASCEKWLKDEDLTMARMPYCGQEIRIDGYYYYLYNGRVLDTYFFYRNGVIISAHGASGSHPLDELDVEFHSDSFVHSLHKYDYGVFQIINDSIVWEVWELIQGPKSVLRFSGKILSDTSFVINQMELPHSGQVYPRHEVSYFHEFFPKPDSTNIYIP